MKNEKRLTCVDIFIRENFVDHITGSIRLHRQFDISFVQEKQTFFCCCHNSDKQPQKLFPFTGTVTYQGAKTIRGFIRALVKLGRHDEALSWWEKFLRNLDLLCNDPIKSTLDVGKHISIQALDTNGKLLIQNNIISFGLSHPDIAYPSNVNLRSGKWYFEICVQNPSDVCVGWCDNSHPIFDPDLDENWKKFRDSKKFCFNLKHKLFGFRWKKWDLGDYVGSSIDLESRKIQFFLNGDHVKRYDLSWKASQTISNSVFPTVLGGCLFQCTINIGNEPFRYPAPEGYLPVYDSVS